MTKNELCRFDGDVADTEKLLAFILVGFDNDLRIQFLCAPGDGVKALARLRTKLSRVRKSLDKKGKPRKHFLMLSRVFPWTENGKRWDSVIVEKKKTEQHAMLERFEDFAGAQAL